MKESDAQKTVEAIRRLKEKRNAVVLAHNYQRPEVQDLADHLGDSLELSRLAVSLPEPVIVFCGVTFMAETAAILSPEKTVLLPEPKAGCPLADMITAEELRQVKGTRPGVPVVCYVNSSAEVKAESDYACTSANAVEVVDGIDAEAVLFVPDWNLGHWAGGRVKKQVIAWSGHCGTHSRLTAADVEAARKKHPEAEFICHPECVPEVNETADAVLSTSGMMRHVAGSPAKAFIIGTEEGILHRLRKENPGKTFHLASPKMVCPNMKLTTLEKIRTSLENMQHRIIVPEPIRERALSAIERMVAVRGSIK